MAGRLFARLRRPTAREKVDGYRLIGPCGAYALLPSVGQGAGLRQHGEGIARRSPSPLGRFSLLQGSWLGRGGAPAAYPCFRPFIILGLPFRLFFCIFSLWLVILFFVPRGLCPLRFLRFSLPLRWLVFRARVRSFRPLRFALRFFVACLRPLRFLWVVRVVSIWLFVVRFPRRLFGRLLRLGLVVARLLVVRLLLFVPCPLVPRLFWFPLLRFLALLGLFLLVPRRVVSRVLARGLGLVLLLRLVWAFPLLFFCPLGSFLLLLLAFLLVVVVGFFLCPLRGSFSVLLLNIKKSPLGAFLVFI